MKKVHQIIAMIVILSMVCSSCVLNTYATNQTSQYEKLTDYLSEEKAFLDDKIIVILDNTSSVSFKSFNADFEKIVECSSIHDLTAFKTQKIKAYIENRSYLTQSNDASNIANDIELEKYNKILCLNLKDTSKEKILDAIENLNKLDGVLCAFPDFEISIDSLMSNSNSIQTESTPNDIYDLLSLNQAWQSVSNFTPNTVRVAVIDTGINKDHSALVGKIDENTSARMIGYVGEEYDNFDDYVGVEHIDDNGHGTHVAGIIAASLDSETGMRGVCTSVELISIKVLNDLGKGRFSDLVAGMAYVASLDGTANEIDVVNISAGTADYYYQEILQSSLTSFISDYNGLVVCSAGNENADLSKNNRFPASIEGDNIITVGASNADDTRWESSTTKGSNYDGPVDIFAPGVDIVSCVPNGSSLLSCPDNCSSEAHISDGYHALTGTSMATPFVTGVAALMLSIYPNLSAEYIKSVITDMENVDYSTSSQNPINELFWICDSGGRVNAYKAVQAAIDYNTTPCTHSNATYTYTADTHTFTCPDCSYTFTEPHNDFTYTSNNANTHTRRCSDCPHTLIEAHNDFSYTYNAYTHSLKCSDCSYSTGYGLHDGSYITYNENTHTYSCSVCPYMLTSAHELFVYSDNGEDGVTIKCNTCNYMRTCYVGVAEYGSGGDNGHYVSCTCGCYNFLSPHIPAVVTSTGDLYTHQAFCRDCGVYYQAAHSWVAKSYGTVQGYECLMCNMFSISVPGIMQIPSGDEILIASGDENGTAIALLPEKEDDLVTE